MKLLRGILHLSFLAAAACSSPEPQPVEITSDPLLSSLQVSTAGDVVSFVLQVTNTGEQPVVLTFPTGQTHDFLVSAGDREVWRWSNEQMFTQALQEDTIAAGESRQFEGAWSPPDSVSGELLAAGYLTSTGVAPRQETLFVLP